MLRFGTSRENMTTNDAKKNVRLLWNSLGAVRMRYAKTIMRNLYVCPSPGARVEHYKPFEHYLDIVMDFLEMASKIKANFIEMAILFEGKDLPPALGALALTAACISRSFKSRTMLMRSCVICSAVLAFFAALSLTFLAQGAFESLDPMFVLLQQRALA